LECGRLIALYHHEKYDGTGYPYGISGEDIPLCARIMALADVYDALVSDRIYRKAMSHDEAYDIILKGEGSHFDPKIVEVFRENHDTYKNMKLNMKIKSIY
jgi:putative two-component system response regulator